MFAQINQRRLSQLRGFHLGTTAAVFFGPEVPLRVKTRPFHPRDLPVRLHKTLLDVFCSHRIGQTRAHSGAGQGGEGGGGVWGEGWIGFFVL